MAGRYGFQNRAVLEHIEGELQRLREPLIYRSRGSKRYRELVEREFIVPAGLVFDGASIPRVTWALMPSKSDTAEEGALHDWAFRVGPHLGIYFAGANWLLWEALTISGDGWAWQRSAMWAAVASGGALAWNRWRKAALRHDDPMTLATFDPERPPFDQ